MGRLEQGASQRCCRPQLCLVALWPSWQPEHGLKLQTKRSVAAGGLWAAPWQDGALLATELCWVLMTADFSDGPCRMTQPLHHGDEHLHPLTA